MSWMCKELGSGKSLVFLIPTRPKDWPAHMFKVQMCRYHAEGRCERGHLCRYAHEVTELRERRARLKDEELNSGQMGKVQKGETAHRKSRNPLSHARLGGAASKKSGRAAARPPG